MVGGIVVRFEEMRRQFRNVEVWPDQSNGPAEGAEGPFCVEGAAADLAARPQHRLHRQPARAPDDRRRSVVGGRQPRPDAERPEPDGQFGRPHRRQHRRRVRRRRPRPGRVAEGARPHLGRHQRRPAAPDAGRRQDVDQCDEEPARSAAVGDSFRSIVASRDQAGTAYVVVDLHQVNNRDPFIYKTADFGRTFRAITTGIPKSMLSYAKAILRRPRETRPALRRHRERD